MKMLKCLEHATELYTTIESKYLNAAVQKIYTVDAVMNHKQTGVNKT